MLPCEQTACAAFAEEHVWYSRGGVKFCVSDFRQKSGILDGCSHTIDCWYIVQCETENKIFWKFCWLVHRFEKKSAYENEKRHMDWIDCQEQALFKHISVCFSQEINCMTDYYKQNCKKFYVVKKIYSADFVFCVLYHFLCPLFLSDGGVARYIFINV